MTVTDRKIQSIFCMGDEQCTIFCLYTKQIIKIKLQRTWKLVYETVLRERHRESRRNENGKIKNKI